MEKTSEIEVAEHRQLGHLKNSHTVHETQIFYCIYEGTEENVKWDSFILTKPYHHISGIISSQTILLTYINTLQTVVGFQTTSYMSLNSCKSETHDKKKRIPVV